METEFGLAKMFDDVIWKPEPSLLIPTISWFMTTFHGVLTWIIVRYILSKVSMRRTVLDTSNMAIVTLLFVSSWVHSIANTLLSVTTNAGWAVSNSLGFFSFVAGFLSHSELIANALIQASVITFPCAFHSQVFNSISKKTVKLGLPIATVVIYGLLEVFSGSKYLVIDHLMGKHTQPLGEDTWTIVLLVTRVASALTASSVRIYIYRLRKRLNLPSENNLISNLSVTIICVMNIIYFGVVLLSRMTLEPGDTKIAVIMIRALVPACIVFSNDSIWNHACDLPLFRFVTKYLMSNTIAIFTW